MPEFIHMFVVACSTLTHSCDIQNPFKSPDPVKCEAELKDTLAMLKDRLKDEKSIVIFGSCVTIMNKGDPV